MKKIDLKWVKFFNSVEDYNDFADSYDYDLLTEEEFAKEKAYTKIEKGALVSLYDKYYEENNVVAVYSVDMEAGTFDYRVGIHHFWGDIENINKVFIKAHNDYILFAEKIDDDWWELTERE